VAIIYYDKVKIQASDDESQILVDVLKGVKPNDEENYVWQSYTADTADMLDGSFWSDTLGLTDDWYEGL